jgi:hypothetical protein
VSTATRGAGTPSAPKEVSDKMVPFRHQSPPSNRVRTPMGGMQASVQEDSHGEGADGHIRSP